MSGSAFVSGVVELSVDVWLSTTTSELWIIAVDVDEFNVVSSRSTGVVFSASSSGWMVTTSGWKCETNLWKFGHSFLMQWHKMLTKPKFQLFMAEIGTNQFCRWWLGCQFFKSFVFVVDGCQQRWIFCCCRGCWRCWCWPCRRRLTLLPLEKLWIFSPAFCSSARRLVVVGFSDLTRLCHDLTTGVTRIVNN